MKTSNTPATHTRPGPVSDLFETLKPGPLRDLAATHLPNFVRQAVPGEWLDSTRTVQLAVGGKGSGAQFHYHKAAVNTLVYGRKRWWISPPRDALYSRVPAGEWAEEGVARGRREGRVLLQCEQQAGDVLFVPDFWGHATCMPIGQARI